MNDHFYVADHMNNRIQFFCNGSSTDIKIAGSGTDGTSLSDPCDIKLNSQLNFYVAENSDSRVMKFAKL
jgi:hypothetical protein